MSKIIKKLVADNPDKIESWTHEKGSYDESYGNGYWIYLKKGWINGADTMHCIHEWTVKDVLDKWKTVEICELDCDECYGTFADNLAEL